FPASFELRLRPEKGSPAQVATLADSLTSIPGVQEVRFDALWLRKVRAILRAAWVGGAVIGIVLLGAAVLTISAVIRMGVYERRDEIEILRLVGANPGFIRAPLLVEGALQGFLGGVAALLLISGTWIVATRSAFPPSVPLVGEMLA